VILVDWSCGAKTNFLNYGQAAGNTRLVGVQIAELIKFLISCNGGSSDHANRFYIVGFSLGAHVAGFAGSHLRTQNMKLGRITGKVSMIVCLSYYVSSLNFGFLECPKASDYVVEEFQLISNIQTLSTPFD